MATATEAVSSAFAGRVIDLDALLAPISGDNPAGENLQYSGLHDEIREARREDEDLEQGEWQHDRKAADWPRVVSLATEALATRTKDLQIAAWLAEALVKTQGFIGLRDGLRIMRELLERFWDSVYPQNDEGDLEARANTIAWMDRPLVVPKAVRDVPITRSITGLRYSCLQWEQSKEFDIPERLDDLDSEGLRRIEESKQRAAEEGKITGEQWRLAKNATRRAFYEEIYPILSECWDEFEALDRVMDEKFGQHTPGLGLLKRSLDDVRSVVEKLLTEKRILEPDPVGESAGEDEMESSSGEQQPRSTTGPIHTRQEALRRLAEVANFFRKTEPHSPVSYLVQRAIKWGQMPLETWLEDVIKNDGVLDNLRETLGLTTLPGGSSHEQDGS
jgi:type VI secretion system protein ImpA